MKPLIDPQELARRNNESAAVHRTYGELRLARRQLRLKPCLPEKILDRLDRLNAERVARPTRAIGYFLAKKK